VIGRGKKRRWLCQRLKEGSVCSRQKGPRNSPKLPGLGIESPNPGNTKGKSGPAELNDLPPGSKEPD